MDKEDEILDTWKSIKSALWSIWMALLGIMLIIALSGCLSAHWYAPEKDEKDFGFVYSNWQAETKGIIYWVEQ